VVPGAHRDSAARGARHAGAHFAGRRTGPRLAWFRRMRFLGVAAVVLAFGIAPVAHGQSAPVEIADGLAPVPPPPAAMLVVPSADLAESPLRPLGEAVVGLGGLAGLLLFDGAATLVA
jgi:hypothetical protein